jgi:hypothetical protein
MGEWDSNLRVKERCQTDCDMVLRSIQRGTIAYWTPQYRHATSARGIINSGPFHRGPNKTKIRAAVQRQQ